MALRFNIIPVEFHFKFEQCVANIRKKPELTLDIAAAYHEQLQLMTDYIDIFNMDDAIVNIMLDSFIALTYQLSLSVTECLLSELGILRCFNDFAKSLIRINPVGLPTQDQSEYKIFNEDFLMEFYNINECAYRPCSPSNVLSESEFFQSISFQPVYTVFNSTEIKQEPIEYIILD